MFLYSQRDPAYDRLKLGESNLTVHGYGCFLVSLASLFQKSPQELLKISGAFQSDGNLRSAVIAAYCGGSALPQQDQAPEGWGIAITKHFKDVGYPTHFFLANKKLNLMADPLKFPTTLEPISYAVSKWRPFTGGKFDSSLLPEQSVFPDVPTDRWSAEAIRKAKKLGLMKGYQEGLFKPEQSVTREELAAVIVRLYDLIHP